MFVRRLVCRVRAAPTRAAKGFFRARLPAAHHCMRLQMMPMALNAGMSVISIWFHLMCVGHAWRFVPCGRARLSLVFDTLVSSIAGARPPKGSDEMGAAIRDLTRRYIYQGRDTPKALVKHDPAPQVGRPCADVRWEGEREEQGCCWCCCLVLMLRSTKTRRRPRSRSRTRYLP